MTRRRIWLSATVCYSHKISWGYIEVRAHLESASLTTAKLSTLNLPSIHTQTCHKHFSARTEWNSTAKGSSQRADVVGAMARLWSGRPEIVFRFPEEQDIDLCFVLCRWCCKAQLASSLMRKVESFPERKAARPCNLTTPSHSPRFSFCFPIIIQ